jgi:Ni/Co efflux regulator RcnB
MILPALFWSRNLWIDSWWAFDLPIPPFGYRWVRVDNDALLINTTTGEILQVQHDVFY